MRLRPLAAIVHSFRDGMPSARSAAWGSVPPVYVHVDCLSIVK
jgi:hypothetical protein